MGMKRKIWNRAVSFLMAALLAVTSAPLQALAVEGTESAGDTEAAAAVDWENIIDDCEILLTEGNQERPIENLRDGNIKTLWNVYGSGILKFTFPSERIVEKIAIQMEEGSTYTQTMSLLDAQQKEIDGSKKENVIRQDGYSFEFSSPESMKEFYVKLEGSYCQIAEMQIYAERTVALGTDIAKDCKISVPDTYADNPTGNMVDGNINTYWRTTWPYNPDSCEVEFTLPADSKDPVSGVALQFEQYNDAEAPNTAARSMDVQLKYTYMENGEEKELTLDDSKSKGYLKNVNDSRFEPVGYAYRFSKPVVMKKLTVILSNRLNWKADGTSETGGFCPGISMAQIYVKKNVENIAGSCLLTATKNDAWGNVLSNIQDGKENTIWTADAGTGWPVTVRLELLERKTIQKTVLKFNNAADIAKRTMHIKLEYAKDDNEIRKLISEKTDQVLEDDYEINFVVPKEDIKYLYVTLVKTNEEGDLCPSFREVEIYAEDDRAVPVESVTIEGDKNLTVEQGKTIELTANVTPPEATNKEIQWSVSGEGKDSVRLSGQSGQTVTVTGVQEGTATVTATSADNAEKSDSVTVTVTPVKVTNITISAPNGETELAVPQELTLTASVEPENAKEKGVDWSCVDAQGNTSDYVKLTPSEDGTSVTVKAVEAGKVKITATAKDGSGIKAEYPLVIKWIPVTSITLSKTSLNLVKGQLSEPLAVTITPENASDKTVKWTSGNEKIATVSDTGVVTAVAAGNTTIKASGNTETGVEASVPVEVTEPTQQAQRVTLKDEGGQVKGTLHIQEEMTLDAEITPAEALQQVEFSCVDVEGGDSGIVELEPLPGYKSVKVKAVGLGKVKIRATANDESEKFAEYELEVLPVLVSSVTIRGEGIQDKVLTVEKTAGEGKQTIDLAADVEPENATDKAVGWTSSKPDVATVDDGGTVTVLSTGDTVITATAKDGSGTSDSVTLKVTAPKIPVSEITIRPQGGATILLTGKTLQFEKKVAPEGATDPSVTWSTSDSAVATVDQNGLVTGVAKGDVEIIATAKDGSGVKGTCPLKIWKPVTQITITPQNETAEGKGQAVRFTAALEPSDASETGIRWSVANADGSQTDIATIDEDGTVHTLKSGTVTVTASPKDSHAGASVAQTATLTVNPVAVRDVTVTAKGNASKVTKGRSLKLSATTEPDNATVASITWETSNDKIATVDGDGLVTAVAEGDVTITAKVKGESGEAEIAKTIDLTVTAEGERIDLAKEGVRISAKNATAHGIGLAVDGKKDTFWQSIPSDGEGDDYMKNRMYDHNRYIDIVLDGTYDLTRIDIFNRTNGSFNNYYVYASEDGVKYDKIISKTSNAAATAEGDSYDVNKTASYLRLNMAYNSDAYVTNLAEIEVWGVKAGDEVKEPDPISVEDWNDSDWKTEWDKFEANENGYADQKVLNEMSSLVGRVIGEKWKDSFRFELRDSLEESKDVFELKDGENGVIVIRGNNGVAMASGFNYYLKNYVNVDYNPMYSSNTNLKKIAPVGKRVVKEAQFDLRYALNFCTYSYTMSFWNWDEYEKFLDWAAMNGINLILDIVGQEEVLRQTFAEFGYTDEEVKEYISGPAYFAWFYMQNLYSIGGPLPDSWFEGRVELGRKMHDRMQTYGIDPVIQGFAGQVPDTFVEKNEGSVFTPECDWSGFTRPSILKTYLTEEEIAQGKVDYYQSVADVFYAKQKNVFGDVSHYYAADPFHEGGATGNLDLSEIYKAVQVKMLQVDPDAMWVMQQWQTNLNTWKMSKLDTKHTLPLDLNSTMNPEYSYFEDNGSKWIYNMLHNFGGRMGLDGDIVKMSKDPIETFQKTNNMVGIGMTPEAMENSPVVYEMLFDTTWSKDPIDYRAWTKKYGERRAGGTSDSLNEAWKILLETAYAEKNVYYQGAAETVINCRPGDGFNSASTWGHSNIYYDKAELDKALLLLVENYEAFSESPAYKYDLADVAEQVICNAAVEYHKLMVQAKNARDLEEFTKLSTDFLELIDLSDKILATTDGFLLGTWIEAARKMITGADDWTKDLFEFNARSLVTTWGGERVGSLKDYSNRKWAGLTKNFYRERWAIWIRNRMAELKGEQKNPADEKAESNWFLWEFQWANRKSDDEDGKYAFATVPTDDDLGALAVRAYDEFSYTNLEKNTGGTAQETVNLAEGMPVSVGSQTADGDPANLTDGKTNTGWKAQGAGPHTMTVDFGETVQANGMVISIEQIAKDYPYTWTAEYLDPESSEWVSLGTNAQDAAPIMRSTTEITKTFTASQVRLIVTTSDLTDSPVYVTEITVNGVREEKEDDGLENLAFGITPSVTNKDGGDVGGPVERLTDGDVSALWSPAAWDNSLYPVSIELDLGQEAYTEYVDVQFESPGRPFAFYVSVTDASGAKEKVSSEYENVTEALEKGAYRISVQKKARKVTVCLVRNTGVGAYPGSWPALSEIRVMGIPSVSEQDLSANPVTGITVSGEAGATNKVLSDNKSKDLNDAGAYDLLALNEEAVFDLGATHYLSHVNFVFEKPGLALKYEVYAEDADGNRELLESYDSPANQLAERVVRVNAGREAKKIIFIHHGNGTPEESPNAYLAEPRLYGFEAYGVAKSSVSAQQAEGLTGTAGNYQAKAGTPATLALDRPAEVNMIKVIRAEGETKALSYMAEYYDAQDEEWKMFADRTGADASAQEVFAVVKKGVFTGKVRLTFAEDVRIGDIFVYNTDTLLKRVSQIEGILAGLKYDGTHGSYKAEAKEKLEAVLADAKEVTGDSPQIVNEWMDTLDRALDEFYETGELFIDRSGLLASMASVKELIGKYQPEGQDLADLRQMYETSRNLYEAYGASQTQIGAASAENEERLFEIGIRIETQKDPDLAAARTDMKAFLEGLEEKDPAEYEPESWKNYTEALEAANAVLSDWSTTGARIDSVKASLAAAEAALKHLASVLVREITIHAEKTTLQAGETLQLTTEVLPENADNQEVTWSISAEEASIAEVDENGLVTAKAKGTVVVTATAKDGSEVSGEIKLTVTKDGDEPDDPVLAEEINVRAEGDKTTLKKGEMVQLTAEVLPEGASQKVVWSSGDTGIAVVDQEGLVTAKSKGSVTITATAEDDDAVKGDIKLTVTEDGGIKPPVPVKVSGVTVSAQGNKKTLQEGESVKLTAAVLPGNASNKAVTWTSGNPASATVDQSGKVTAKAPGSVTVTATAKDGSRKSGSITLTVLPKTGKIHKDKKLVYKITSSTETEKTVTVQKPVKSNDKKIMIPPVVKINNFEYKVTAIEAKAFRKKSKLQTVTIGANVKTIGKQAFYNCKKLKTIKILSKGITKIDAQAFGKIVKKATITVPKAKYKAYKKLLQKKAKVAKTVKIAKAKK